MRIANPKLFRRALALAVVVILADQASKWAIAGLFTDPFQVIELTPFFNLVAAHNTGVSFSMLQGMGPWLLIVLVLLVLNVVLVVIPVVGHLAMQLLYPVFAGGLLLGCRAIDRGQPLTVNHLFAGFGERTGQLLILGLLYLCLAVAITLAVAGILLGSAAGLRGALRVQPLGSVQDARSDPLT